MRPIIVVTADTMGRDPVEEYYVFHRCPDVPFLYLRTSYSPEHPGAFDFGLYPDKFSAQSLLARAFQQAKDRFQFEIRHHDRELHRELFSLPTPISYEEINEQHLAEFQMFGSFVKERAIMGEGTHSRAIRELHARLSEFPVLKLGHEPEGQS